MSGHTLLGSLAPGQGRTEPNVLSKKTRQVACQRPFILFYVFGFENLFI